MNTKILLWPAAALLTLSSMSAQAISSPPVLNDYGFNLDGDISYPLYGDPVPAGVNTSLFDDLLGLGTITATITGAGAHNFAAYFDHDISLTWDNEAGSTINSAASGQSWEIDMPPLAGDIDINFEANTLDNSIANTLPDDVAMAMGWDFTLGLGQTAGITLLLSDVLPATSSLILAQDNIVSGVSNYTIYLTGDLSITGCGITTTCDTGDNDNGNGTVPEPSIMLLMGLGLAGMVVSRRKNRV
jgi:hypothetical protein